MTPDTGSRVQTLIILGLRHRLLGPDTGCWAQTLVPGPRHRFMDPDTGFWAQIQVPGSRHWFLGPDTGCWVQTLVPGPRHWFLHGNWFLDPDMGSWAQTLVPWPRFYQILKSGNLATFVFPRLRSPVGFRHWALESRSRVWLVLLLPLLLLSGCRVIISSSGN